MGKRRQEDNTAALFAVMLVLAGVYEAGRRAEQQYQEKLRLYSRVAMLESKVRTLAPELEPPVTLDTMSEILAKREDKKVA